MEQEKPIKWVGSSYDDVVAFPPAVRRKAGYALYRVQTGLMPSDWKPMKTVGRGTYEIRSRADREHRVFYIGKSPEAVYVLHAFEKKRRKTSRRDIELGRKRYAEVARHRREFRTSNEG